MNTAACEDQAERRPQAGDRHLKFHETRDNLEHIGRSALTGAPSSPEGTEPTEGADSEAPNGLAEGSPARVPLTPAERVWLAVVAVLTAGFCAFAVNSLHYGFDFTDEGFYLLWMSSPEAFTSTLSWFGVVYHPLYALAGGDIFLLRIFGFVLSVGLAWWLAYRTLAGPPFLSRINRVAIGALGAGVATAAWASGAVAPTPNYVALTIQGLLLTSIGLSYVWRPPDHLVRLGWVLIGLGLFVTFMAKPTAAAAAGLLIVLALLLSRSFTWRGGLSAVAVASIAGAFATLVLAGSPGAVLREISTGLDLSRSLVSGHTLGRAVSSVKKFVLMRDWWGASWEGVILLAGLVVCTAVAVLAGRSSTRAARIVAAVLSGTLAITAGWVLVSASNPFPVDEYQLRFMLAVSPVLVGLLVLLSSATQRCRTLHCRGMVVAALFAALPFAAWFGSNVPIFPSVPWAAAFWALSGLVFVVATTDTSRLIMACIPVVLLVLVSSSLMVVDANAHPRRMPAPLKVNTESVQINPSGKILRVEEGDRQYIESLRKAADTAGFEPGTSVIDLTGQSPGSVYVLGGVPPVTPWLLGGYPGSEQFTEDVLFRPSCSVLARAWVLSDGGGSRSIDSEVLGVYGAELERDFENVGVVSVRDFSKGNPNLRNVEQSLWQPLRDPAVAEESCEAARTAAPAAG